MSEIANKVTEKNAGLQYIEIFTNSAEFGVISQRDFFDHDIAKLGSLGGYYIVRREDFVYNPRISTFAPVGPINCNKLGRIGVMSPLYIVFRTHDVDTKYLEHYFKSKYWYSFMNFNGDSGARSDRFSIKDSVFFEMPIPIPYIEEQRKIGEYLTHLDNLITLHQREDNKYLRRKSRNLEKINMKNIKIILKMINFIFNYVWEQRKFADLVQIERGGSPRPIEDYITDASNGLNWIKIGDAPIQGNYITKTAEKIRPEGLSKTREVHPGDLILSNSMSFGKPYIMRINGCIHDGWLLIRDNEKVFDLIFLCHLLGTPQMLEQYRSLAAGSTVNNLNKELVGSTFISVPKIEEQNMLGIYLEKLDNLITLHHRKQNFSKIHYFPNEFHEKHENKNNKGGDNMKYLKLYHGSNVAVREPKLLPMARALDFGAGFYLTTSYEQAKKWAELMVKRRRTGVATVSVYEVEEDKLSCLKFLQFECANIAWLKFISANRKAQWLEEEWDIVAGPVANDNTMPVINLYLKGSYNEEEALKRLLPQKLKDQYAFKTEKALEILRLCEVILI